MTNLEDALAAANLGADALGFIFHEPSPRHIEVAQASAITKALPPFISKVGIFVDKDPHYVTQVIQTVWLDYLQFHGNEPAAYCRSFGKPYIKMIPISNLTNTSAIELEYDDASAFLFDTSLPGLQGGSGITFDWDTIPTNLKKPFILAGGLNQDNVRDALAKVKPYAVDVTSGIEKKKGIKDLDKMKKFLTTVLDYSLES